MPSCKEMKLVPRAQVKLPGGRDRCCGRAFRRDARRPLLADPTDEESERGQLDPDYAAGKKAIEAKDWNAAIKALSSAALRDTRNADIQNYLGFAYRNAGEISTWRSSTTSRRCSSTRAIAARTSTSGEAYLMVDNLPKRGGAPRRAARRSASSRARSSRICRRRSAPTAIARASNDRSSARPVLR